MSVRAIVDGTDVTDLVQQGSVTHQHNQPSFATVEFPKGTVPAGDASRCKIVVNGSLDFHGLTRHIERQGDENTISTTFTFVSPASLFEYRPARDGVGSGDVGDFSKPTFIERNQTAPQMIEEILTQSLDDSDPADGEGPMGISLGTFESGGANLEGAPADYPMSIAQTISLLAQTGELDVVETPIDSGGNMTMVSAYNGNFGTDRSGSFHLQYAMGSTSNCRSCRWTVDLSQLVNKLWLYLGPRVGTKADPAGDQHWAANVTGTSDFTGHDPPASAVLAARDASQSSYFVRMLIRIFDGDESAALDLYKRWWLTESWLRCRPKQIVAMTPHRGIAPGFRTGDLIRVQAGTSFGGGFSGVQRVMAYTYRWDTEGVIELGEPVGQPAVPAVVTSADQEGV